VTPAKAPVSEALDINMPIREQAGTFARIKEASRDSERQNYSTDFFLQPQCVLFKK